MGDLSSVAWTGQTVPPTWRILVNGAVAPGTILESGDFSQTNYSKGDTFSAKVVLDLTKAVRPFWFDPSDPNAVVDITLQFAILSPGTTLGSEAWVSMFQGVLDKVGFDQTAGLLELEGRDYMAKLIDLQIQSSWLNHTSADLVTLLIQQAGLTRM